MLKKRKKKPGRKARWSQSMLDDFVDIVISSENFKKKLIFMNTKTQQNGETYKKILEELKERGAARGEAIPFTVAQLRSKFKKCIGECKRCALTIKTATGIKRFQEDKGYGSWFNQLFALVKTRDSCNPEQALEPSAESNTKTSSSDSFQVSDSCGDTPVFVPVKSSSKKQKREDVMIQAINLMKSAIENDPTKNLIEFMKDDIQKSREHELKLFSLMMAQPSYQSQESRYQGFTSNMATSSQPQYLQPGGFFPEGHPLYHPM